MNPSMLDNKTIWKSNIVYYWELIKWQKINVKTRFTVLPFTHSLRCIFIFIIRRNINEEK